MLYSDELAKRANIDEKLANQVVMSFWNSLRYYLSKPFESKSGILFQGFGKFELNDKMLYHKLLDMTLTEKKRLYLEELFKHKMEHSKEGKKKVIERYLTYLNKKLESDEQENLIE